VCSSSRPRKRSWFKEIDLGALGGIPLALSLLAGISDRQHQRQAINAIWFTALALRGVGGLALLWPPLPLDRSRPYCCRSMAITVVSLIA